MSELQQHAPAPSLHEWCGSEVAQAVVQEHRPELLALARHLALGGDGRRYAEKHRLPLAAMRREVEALKQLQQVAHEPAPSDNPGQLTVRSEKVQSGMDSIPPCSDDPEMFFSTDPVVIALAKEVCQRCGLQDPCLEASFELNELKYGIWGGLTPEERQALKYRILSSSDYSTDR